MYEIIFYEDEKGCKPVLEYLNELSAANGKESRLRLKKAQDYINVLKTYGKTVGEPYMKHLDGEIWELRPTRDRVLFAGAIDGYFILLHQFLKKTQKTPSREIEQAEREYQDLIKREDDAI